MPSMTIPDPQQTPSPIATADITGLILCGGAGQRMGGMDKGLIDYQGRALVDIAIDRLASQVGSILISANRHHATYASRGVRVVRDTGFDPERPTFDGPLAGIQAGLFALETKWLMVVPCDCPMFPTDVVQVLSAVAVTSGHAVYVKDHPVFALLPSHAAPALDQFLNQGQRKLGEWLQKLPATAVSWEKTDAFRNINTPHDLSQAP
jgi:molybdopterin-guanine dinucleotide biosynthesis protein A